MLFSGCQHFRFRSRKPGNLRSQTILQSALRQRQNAVRLQRHKQQEAPEQGQHRFQELFLPLKIYRLRLPLPFA